MRGNDTHGMGAGDITVAGSATVAGAAGIYGATQTSQAGPIIAGVVAIIVALLTWYATDRRQAKALRAEAERLEARLRHDRESADVAELRAVLDVAVSATYAAFSRTMSAYDAWKRAAGTPPAIYKQADALEREAAQHQEKAAEAVASMSDQVARVLIRLPQGHPAATAFEAFRESALSAHVVLPHMNQTTFTAWTRAWPIKLRDERDKFVEEARRLAASQLPAQLVERRSPGDMGQAGHLRRMPRT